jgi:hypothetical protein
MRICVSCFMLLVSAIYLALSALALSIICVRFSRLSGRQSCDYVLPG